MRVIYYIDINILELMHETEMRIIKKQKGFGLLDVTLAIGIAISVMILNMQDAIIDFDQTKARRLGVQLYTYNNAVRSYISNNAAMVLPFDPPPGVAWLKTPACGGLGAFDYLPCNFPAVAEFGVIFDTLIDLDLAGFTVATTTTPPVMNRGGARADIAGLAALTASGGIMSNLVPVFAATEGSFTSDPTTAIITAQASNNAPLDVWLRVDGANTMNAVFEFNVATPGAMREIINLRTIRTLGLETLDIVGDVWIQGDLLTDTITTNDAISNLNNDLSLSGSGDAIIGDTLYVDHAAIIGSVDDIDTDNNALFSEGDLGIGSDIFIDGTATIDNILLSRNDINALGDPSLTVSQSISSPYLIDSDDGAYYLDPNGTSSLFDITANQIDSDINNVISKSQFGQCTLGGGTIADCTEEALQLSGGGGIAASLEGMVDVNKLMVKKHFINPTGGPISLNADPLDNANTKWVSLQRLLPNFVHRATFVVARDGDTHPVAGAPVVMKPECGDAGEPRIILTPVQMPVNIQNDLGSDPSCGLWGSGCGSGKRYGGFLLAAQSDDIGVINPGPPMSAEFHLRWKIIMRSAPEVNSSGGISMSALAHTYCYYGF